MRNLIVLISLVAAFSATANERVKIAKTFVGEYKLKAELVNQTDDPCSAELVVFFWDQDKFLDLQFVDRANFNMPIEERPSRRIYMENSWVFDVINKVNLSEDEKHKTTTRITNTRIEEKNLKGKPDDYKFVNQANFSKIPFNGDVRFEYINKKKKRKECLYSRL